MSKTIKPIFAKFDLTGLPEIINKSNKRTAENERRSYYRTTQNWDDKPTFYIEVNKTYSGGIEDYKVYTDSSKYLWIDEGTEWHTITPNGDYPLRVRGAKEYGYPPYNKIAYDPKTSREGNKLTSNGSGQYLDDDGFFNAVRQKIEPRNFTKMIAEKAPQRWETALNTEIKKYVNKKVK